MADFMKIYSPTNKTITVVDNHTGVPQDRVITLKDYNVKYSYYSEKGAFTNVRLGVSCASVHERIGCEDTIISKIDISSEHFAFDWFHLVNKTATVIRGDGTGRELVNAMLKVLKECNSNSELILCDAGSEWWKKNNGDSLYFGRGMESAQV